MKSIDTPWPAQTYTDTDGHAFRFVSVDYHNADDLIVHFSAFFGDWADARPYREHFGGYFHRLKMLGTDPTHNWLFLCDPYGVHNNGTYYTGQRGDLFVERAMLAIIRGEIERLGITSHRLVTVGSSMGATAALKFGLLLDAVGVIAIAPHIDLDVCAERQNRWDEVAFICPDGDPLSKANLPLTRQVRGLLCSHDSDRPPPRLFIQSCEDDAGAHEEQVVPLVAAWRAAGGRVDHDVRPKGGHTSSWATRELLLDAIDGVLNERDIDVDRYKTDARFAGEMIRPPITHRIRRRLEVRRRLHVVRKRLRSWMH